MEAHCLRQTELPHTSSLFSDFLYRFDRVRQFYEDGRDSADYPSERREELVRALSRLNPPGPSLELLGQPGTAAVVTGQQVGLYSGPAYTVYKALTAVKLARQMTADGRPAVPVFWLATEDHDFAEVNHAWLFDGAATPTKLEVRAAAGDQPVGNIAVEQWPSDELATLLGDFPYGDEILEQVTAAYRPGQSMGAAFHELLRRLLGSFGLLFIDPLDAAVRRLAAPLLREAVAAAPDLNRLLLERNLQLTGAGYHTQVHVEPSTSLFFVLDGDRRIALKRQNGHYVNGSRRWAPDELAGNAEHLSPNALLRPVVQDFMLPTAAYVGGPAELAYFAQSQVLYHELLGAMPHLVPRAGFTIVEPRSAKLMQRYELRVQDFFHGEDPLRERISKRLVPPELQVQFAETNAQAQLLLNRLHESVNGFDPTLGAAARKSREKILHQLNKIEAKVARESMRRNERAGADACYLYGTLFPHKHLQERFYSILPFAARHGMGLFDALYDSVHLGCPDHIVLRLDA